MTTKDPDQVPPSLADIGQEKIENIAEKIWYRRSLNAKDRQAIYFALTGEWEPLSLFQKTRGPKSKALQFMALAEDVERILADGQHISDHMADLGEKHQLRGLENVSQSTFDKNLKSGRESLDRHRLFKKNLEYRKRKKTQGNM